MGTSACVKDDFRINDRKSSKSKAIVISRSNMLDNLHISIPIVESMKFLGVIINKKLNWKTHAAYICKKACQRLHILRRLKRLVSKKELHEIYTSFIRSVLEYACPAFIGMSNGLSQKLQKVDKRAHKIIKCSMSRDHNCTCGKNELYLRRQTLSKNLFRKIVKNKHHSLHSRIPNRLHFSGHYEILFSRTHTRSKSFFIRVPKMFNKKVCST